MTLIRNGTVEQGRLVFAEPLPLPEGSEVVVALAPAGRPLDSAQLKEAEAFAALPAFGMWAERADMQDSVAWVEQERAKWRQRLSGLD